MADIDLSLAVAKQVEEMRKAGGQPADEAFDRLAGQIARAFKARRDEVAILRLSSGGSVLRFLYPLRLAKIGAIPITTVRSLATKNIREKKGEVVNNFPMYKHPTVFEAVDLSEEQKATPIQKIVSAPIVVDETVVGVIQVSRKGKQGEPSGPDFTPRDLAELMKVGIILGKFLATLPAVRLAPGEHAKP